MQESPADIEIARQSTRGSLLLFVGNFLQTAVLAVAAITIARLLGPDGYGLYALALLVPNVAQSLVGLGVTYGITRYSAYHLSKGEVDVAKRMTLSGIIFLLVFGASLSFVAYASSSFVALAVLHRAGLQTLIQVSSTAILAQSLFSAATAGLQGWRLMGAISLANVAQSLSKLAIATALILFGLGVLGALVGHIISLIFGGVLALALLQLRAKVYGREWAASFKLDIRTMTFYSLPLYVGSVVSIVSSQYVVIFMAAIANNVQIGFYQSASNLTSAIGLVTLAISTSLFPAFAHLDGKGANLALAFRYAVKYVGFVVTPIVFFTIGAAGPVIGILYGSSYQPAALYLVLLALSNLPILLGFSVLPTFFTGVGRTRLAMYFSLANGGTVFLLAPLVVELGLGIEGLIYSIIAANFVSMLVGLYLGRRYFGAGPDLVAAGTVLGSSLLAYTAMLAIAQLRLAEPFLISLQLGTLILVYLSVAPVLHAITADDIVRLSIAVEGLGRVLPLVMLLLEYEKRILALSGRLSRYVKSTEDH